MRANNLLEEKYSAVIVIETFAFFMIAPDPPWSLFEEKAGLGFWDHDCCGRCEDHPSASDPSSQLVFFNSHMFC